MGFVEESTLCPACSSWAWNFMEQMDKLGIDRMSGLIIWEPREEN